MPVRANQHPLAGYPVRRFLWRAMWPLRVVLRHFPRLKGGRFLGAALKACLPPKGEFAMPVPGGGKILVRHRESLGMAFLVHGAFERAEIDEVRRRIGQGDVVVDVGAHVGYFTTAMALRVGEKGVVLACEPVSESCERLRVNLAANGLRNARVFQCACWSSLENLQITVTADPAFSSLTRLRGSSPVDVRSVPARPLDDIWKEVGEPWVRLVKVDVEGSEARVLEGARELIARCLPVILVETGEPVHLLALLPAPYRAVQPEGFQPWNWLLEPCELESRG
jgi:FkbM family methyltransferase